MVLQQAGCWEIVGTTMEDSKKDKAWTQSAEEALSYIGLTIVPSQYSHIWTATDGAAAWKALADVYKKNSHVKWISLKRQFYGYCHNTSAPIQGYIYGITTLAAHIEVIGITLSPSEITDILIFNLNESFSIVNITGHPRVLSAVPVPVPVNYPYPHGGYGFASGSAISYLGYTHTRTRGG